MATLTLQRATWCLQVSRTSRLFSVSFTTSIPRNGMLRRLPAELPAPIGSRSNGVQFTKNLRTRRKTGDSETRHAYTTTKVYRAQQTAQRAPASKTTSLDSQPPSQSSNGTSATTPDLSEGLNDGNAIALDGDKQVDWSRSFHGLSTEAFSPEAAKALLAPIPPEDIEVKPDGIIYLPEIKYRRILNQAFGPGGWGLAPRGETIVTAKAVTREYALVALGRLVSVARGEQDYFSPEGIPSAVEGCKSTALRRCCKDLGIASELWDPSFIRKFNSQHVREMFVEHAITKKKRKHYMRKDDVLRYPWKESKYGA